MSVPIFLRFEYQNNYLAGLVILVLNLFNILVRVRRNQHRIFVK